MKRILFLVAVSVVFYSCGTSPESTEAQGEAEIVTVSVESFDEEAPNLVDKAVTIEGFVQHVCRHGGKKMFITGDEFIHRIEVTPAKDLGGFSAESEGSEIVVTGFVRELRVDKAYLDEWEKEVVEGEVEGLKVHVREQHDDEAHEEDDDHHDSDIESVNLLRTKLADSGKDYLSFFSVECTAYTLTPASAE